MEGVLLVAPNASSLSHRRKEFLRAMKDSLVVKHDQRATSHRIASSLEQVKVRVTKRDGPSPNMFSSSSKAITVEPAYMVHGYKVF